MATQNGINVKANEGNKTQAAFSTRFWRYAPLFFWMALTFFASSGEFSASNTSQILRPLLLWFSPDLSDATIDFVHFLVRKSAHFSEYAVFALLSARAFSGSSHDALKRHWFLASLILIALYSLTDEFHQSFVPSRTASVYDSMIDTTGGFVSLSLIALWRAWRKRRRQDTVL
jgi:VanZ family protein